MYMVFKAEAGVVSCCYFETESLEEVKRIVCKSDSFEIWEVNESIKALLEPHESARFVRAIIRHIPAARWIEGCTY